MPTCQRAWCVLEMYETAKDPRSLKLTFHVAADTGLVRSMVAVITLGSLIGTSEGAALQLSTRDIGDVHRLFGSAGVTQRAKSPPRDLESCNYMWVPVRLRSVVVMRADERAAPVLRYVQPCKNTRCQRSKGSLADLSDESKERFARTAGRMRGAIGTPLWLITCPGWAVDCIEDDLACMQPAHCSARPHKATL